MPPPGRHSDRARVDETGPVGPASRPGRLALAVTGDEPPAARAGTGGPAGTDPVALVQVDTGLAHLDRPFEYLVPDPLDGQASPGVRVMVPFAGRDVAGFVLERRAEPEHDGRLRPLRRVVSPEPVLSEPLLRLCRAVAASCAGTLGDVLRLAVPPRHARAEKALAGHAEPPAVPDHGGDDAQLWSRYPAGPALLSRVGAGQAPAAAWLAAPGGELRWPRELAALAAAALAAGRGAVLLVPDAADVALLDAALTARLGKGAHVALTAQQGPQARYTAWLKLLRGHVRCVVGTRSAAFAPVREPGLLACWDDGDDSLAEPRSPYPHARQVLALRAAQEGAALVLGGWTRSPAAQAWLEAGRLRAVEPPRRAGAPLVRVAGDQRDQERDGPAALARLPAVALRQARSALDTGGPVLVQVPRRGYLPALACDRCRRPARCAHCQGPLALAGRGQVPACRWCGRSQTAFECAWCAGTRLRSGVVGAGRTAEELGRAFPGVAVHRSDADHRLAAVPAQPAVVIATPGAEPPAEGGYPTTLLLDAWALLERPGLDAGEEALRRWCAAGALTRPAEGGGVVVLCGAPAQADVPAVAALVRWAPGWFAERELAERTDLRQPPAAWLATLAGDRDTVRRALDGLALPPGADVLGPLPLPPRPGPGGGDEPAGWRAIVRAPWPAAGDLTRALRELRAAHSARRTPGTLQIRVDPPASLL